MSIVALPTKKTPESGKSTMMGLQLVRHPGRDPGHASGAPSVSSVPCPFRRFSHRARRTAARGPRRRRMMGIMEAKRLYQGTGPGPITPDGCAVDYYAMLTPRGEPEL